MSNRTYSRNAYESNLDGALSAGATDFDVDSATGLTGPVILCIDPDDPVKREYVKVTSVSVNTLQTVTRGLDGSAGGAQAHDDAAVIRAVPAHQHLDDIFDDIEALEVDQHAESHTVASHSDTTATGTELGTLTDGSDADALHIHDQYLKEKASGGVAAEVPTHDHSAAGEAGTVTHAAVTGQTVDDHHAEDHATRHTVGGADELDPILLAVTEVDGSIEVASVGLTGTDADLATVNLFIPASWVLWKCVAWATFRAVGANADKFRVRIRIDGTDQQELGDNIIAQLSETGAVGGRRTGMSTTGSRSIILRGRETVGNVTLADIFLYARAVRIS